MAVGFPTKVTYANGDVFSASDINDTNGTLNLLGSSVAYTAGKNKIINGDFRFNQRAFTSNTTSGAYNFDRWLQGNSGGTVTVTPQTFTAGAAPVSGYEAINFAQIAVTGQSAAGDFTQYLQKLEDVRTFAGQTVTVSFWAKASSGTPKLSVELIQGFGSGGSGDVNTSASAATTLSTSWARYSTTIAIPSISGKTIGTSSWLQTTFWLSAGSTYASRANSIGIQTATFQIWGVQLESGSTATAFQTATGTIQGELAACMRYYYLLVRGNSGYIPFANGYQFSSTQVTGVTPFPVAMRTAPTLDMSGGTDYYLFSRNGANDFWNTCISDGSSTTTGAITVTSNISGTGGQGGAFYSGPSNTGSGYIAWSAEL
jgi:hypothetical protein